MTSRSQLGKRARAKGKAFQKTITKLICDTLGIPKEDMHSCVGGKKEDDVQKSSLAKEMFPFHTECKNEKTPRLKAWVDQAESEAEDWLVVFKFHRRRKPYVILPMRRFLEIWRWKENYWASRRNEL